jgi:hypothetical protein
MELEGEVTRFGPPPDFFFVNVSRNGNQVVVTWNGDGILQQADDLQRGGAEFTDVPGHPTSPYTFPPNGARKFFCFRRP